ncbi:D-glycero-alpha-D-manno-heptose-1,7-bisphosphate 7-phosphatase [Gloeothece verrucosa]|uniref:D,D-heptose 1,7-bisphosphate phosphatase n=1 Tax=Gloeothece verrucosa (strain PCC 7822) TaxID=497965 RepID=E0UJZ3_GLOV7|nr:HAD family hydrolase [Gloeothece verrucosa]ADN14629.1 histidinol-phosphate phosphatase family protein [Gloeothece verrucosa PCC 7822]
MAKRAVFLDRDGVLNVEAGYIRRVEDLHLIPKVAQAVRKLNNLGIFCCLVSNQSGPARDYYPVSHVEALHQRLSQLLFEQAGAKLDALYYCPYLSPAAGGVNPEFTAWSSWRKPNTGMLVAAAWANDLDLKQSFMVSDKVTDVDMAHNAGLKGVLVSKNAGKPVIGGYLHRTKPDYLAKDLNEAVTWISKQIKKNLE